MVNKPAIPVTLLVHHWVRHHQRRQRQHTGDFNLSLQVLELTRHFDMQCWEIEHEGQEVRAGWEVDVCGDAELFPHVNHGCQKQVHDQSGNAGRR